MTTYLFQQSGQRRQEDVARRERLRQEQLAAFSAFAGLLTDFRRSQNDSWHQKQEDPDGPLFQKARDESYRLRSQVTATIHRVELLSDDSELVDLAQATLEPAIAIPEASDEGERGHWSDRAREAVDAFVRAAAAHVR